MYAVNNRIWVKYSKGSRGCSVSVETRLHTGSLPLCPDQLWGPPASYPVGTGGSYHGGKVARCESDYSPPSSAEVKNAWSYTSTLQSTLSWHCT